MSYNRNDYVVIMKCTCCGKEYIDGGIRCSKDQLLPKLYRRPPNFVENEGDDGHADTSSKGSSDRHCQWRVWDVICLGGPVAIAPKEPGHVQDNDQ